jgi:hypothetical protein
VVFHLPSTDTTATGAYTYKKGVTSTSFSYIDNSFPHILDKDGGDTISGNIDMKGYLTIDPVGGRLIVDGFLNGTTTGGTLTIGPGGMIFASASTLTLNGTLNGTTTTGTLTIGGSSIVSFAGTILNMASGSSLDIASGGQMLAASGSTVELASGSTLSADAGSTMNLLGALFIKVTPVSGNYTVDSGATKDTAIMVDTVGGAYVITVPTSSGIAGRTLIIKDATGHAGANNLSINRTFPGVIDGVTTYVLATDHSSVILVSDGTNWQVAANKQ